MEHSTSLREYQLYFVYTTIFAIILYYAITFWIPHIQHIIYLEIERRRLITSLQESEPNSEDILAELRDYKSPKVIATETETVTVTRKKPTFALPNRNNTTTISNTNKQKDIQPVPACTAAPSKRTVPKFQLSTPRGSVEQGVVTTPASTNSNSTGTSSSFLGSFNTNSVEARLHSTINQNRHSYRMPNTGMLNNGIEIDQMRIVEERALRERQDTELQLSAIQDQIKSKQEEDKRVCYIFLLLYCLLLYFFSVIVTDYSIAVPYY